MGVLGVHILNELRPCSKVLRQEVHRVPQIVRAPILPVLNDTVQRHLQGTVLVDDALRLSGSLITLLRLPVAVGPQREHRHVACEVTHLGYHTVGTSTVHEVVVNALTGLRGKRHPLGIILKQRRRIVLPIESPALDALQHVLEVLQVRLLHAFFLATTVHLAVLDSSQTVDGLVLVEEETLTDLELPRVLTHHADALFPQEHLTLVRHEYQGLRLGFELHRQLAALPRVTRMRHGNMLRFGGNDQRLRRLIFYHMNDTRREELHLHVLGLNTAQRHGHQPRKHHNLLHHFRT